MDKYKDIINIPYVKSARHKQMSLNDRAAQFAPFSALTGYEESLGEVRRTVTKKKRLSQEAKDLISAKLQTIIMNKIEEKISVTYFIKDTKKDGGYYVTCEEIIYRVDEANKLIYFNNRTSIKISDVFNISSPTLDMLFNEF